MCKYGACGLSRRQFIASSTLSAAVASTSVSASTSQESDASFAPINKRASRITVAFLYPPLEVVEAGNLEDQWAKHKWSTWPGNQFQPEQQQERFTAEIKRMAAKIGVDVKFVPGSLYTKDAVSKFITRTQETQPDAILIVNFWNTFSDWAYRITQEVDTPAIVYHSVGSNHQLPPQNLMHAEGVYYIHSIENWEEIERGLRAVHAKTKLAQSRLLRVGPYRELAEDTDPRLGFKVLTIPADHYNRLFDSIPADAIIRGQAEEFAEKALRVSDVSDRYLADAFRAHETVNRLLKQYGGDAVTIKCLMLEERKPCISFSINNGALTPCGCEDDFNATQTMMLGRLLFERGGFQHNPEFDTSRNQYFASHCTCATRLLGPNGPEQEFWIRPFFHQLPKTAALDVRWEPDAPVFLAKLDSDTVHCWTGSVIESPTSPPTGGCATRVLINIDQVDDVCSIYPGPHPVLYRGTPGEAKRLKAFARLYRIPLRGNV